MGYHLIIKIMFSPRTNLSWSHMTSTGSSSSSGFRRSAPRWTCRTASWKARHTWVPSCTRRQRRASRSPTYRRALMSLHFSRSSSRCVCGILLFFCLIRDRLIRLAKQFIHLIYKIKIILRSWGVRKNCYRLIRMYYRTYILFRHI